MLKINELNKSYSQKSSAANVLVDYCAEFGKRTCLVGPNGTGKSTILLAVSGLMAIDSGEILWDQKVTNKQTRKALAAIASDSVVIPEFLSATQVFELNQHTYKVPWPAKLIEEFNFTTHIYKTVDALSSGNIKKLQLISAMMRNPKILLLDEPNIALDEKSVKILWQYIDNFEGCLIVASNEPKLYAEKGFAIQDIATHSNLSSLPAHE
jgi:ABC-type multidrug transport system ATPase subunit